MGRIDLQLKMTLENIAAVKQPAEADWRFKVKCTSCGEIGDNIIYFNLVEKQQIQGSRGTASYIAKCKGCERSGNIDFIEGSLGQYNDQNGQWQTVAKFECRGMEPCEFFPGTGFSALSSASDTVFGTQGGRDPMDLDEGDWADYDEDADESVAIYEFSSQFVTSSKK